MIFEAVTSQTRSRNTTSRQESNVICTADCKFSWLISQQMVLTNFGCIYVDLTKSYQHHKTQKG
jgi:hypothetical protein